MKCEKCGQEHVNCMTHLCNPIVKDMFQRPWDYSSVDNCTIPQHSKIKIIQNCSKCGKVTSVGFKTGLCLECLDCKSEEKE